MKRKVAVIGLGVFGRTLARELVRLGAEVIAIDSQRDLVEEIGDDVALAVTMDSTDERALLAQGINNMETVVVAIGRNLEANLLTTAILKEKGTPQVVVRAATPLQEKILRALGADLVINPESEAATRLAKRIVHKHLAEVYTLSSGFELAEISAPDSFVGKTLAELDLRRRFQVNLIAIRRIDPATDREIFDHLPGGETKIERGDLLIVVGRERHVRALATS